MTSILEPALPAVDGLEFRALTAADVPAWLDLVERVAMAEAAPWHEQRSDLAAVFADARNPAAENTVAGVDGEGRLRVAARVAKNPEGEKAYAFGDVDPQWQRQGVGTAVLQWQEARIAARFAADRQGAGRVRSFTTESCTLRRELLASRGFEVVRHFFEMRRELTQLPRMEVPEGMAFMPWTLDFNEAARLAHNEAFADHWGSEPRTPVQWQILMNHEHARLDLSTVAVDLASGEVAGYQLAMHDPHDQAAEGRLEGYTELLGVRRQWRGRGLAGALLAAAMTAFTEAGLDYATLDVDSENPTGALGVYERMGYVAVNRSMAWDKSLSELIPEHASR